MLLLANNESRGNETNNANVTSRKRKEQSTIIQNTEELTKLFLLAYQRTNYRILIVHFSMQTQSPVLAAKFQHLNTRLTQYATGKKNIYFKHDYITVLLS